MSSQLVSKLEINKVNDQISIIEYAGFKVFAMSQLPYRNFINATKLCTLGNKEFKEWLKNQSSKDLMEFLRTDLLGGNLPSINSIEVIKIINNEYSNDLRGTYVHPDLLPSILSWISPKFAVEVNRIINLYYAHEKDKEIFDLKKMNEEAERRHQETIHLLIESRDRELAIQDNLDAISDKQDVFTESVLAISSSAKQLGQVTYPAIHPEVLVISKITFESANGLIHVYIVNRCQHRSLLSVRKDMIRRIEIRNKYTLKEITVMFILSNPNPVNLWNRFRGINLDHFIVSRNVIQLKDWTYIQLLTELHSYFKIEQKSVEELQSQLDELVKETNTDIV